MPYVNHLTVPVEDADQVTDFYVDWLGARILPAPRLPFPIAWLLIGKVQVHIIQRSEPVSLAYHFGVAFEDREEFEALYWRAVREGVADRETYDHHIFEASGGAVQLYLRDPAGNLVECDYPDVNDLDPEIAGEIKRWSDGIEQSEWNLSASLFLSEQREMGP